MYNMVITTQAMEELLPYGSNKANKKKVNMDTILPFIILPLLLLLSTLSRTVTIIVMVAIGMGVLYVNTRPRQKNRSPFFFSWTLSSAIYMFIVFEFGVIRALEITQLENFVLLLLAACTCYFFHKMKAVADFELATGSSKGKEYSPVLTSDSHYCQICQIEVNEKFFHSIWWDCCVLRPNYPYFLAGQVFAFATLLFGTNLTLTTVCQPFIFIGTILLPEDCSDVYYQIHLAIYFVSAVYGVGYLLIIGLVLLHQLLVYIPKYSESDCKRIWLNLRESHRRAMKKKKTKSGQAAAKTKKWTFEDEMSFLLPHYKGRETISSITYTSNFEDDDGSEFVSSLLNDSDSQSSTNTSRNLNQSIIRPETSQSFATPFVHLESASSVTPTPPIRSKRKVVGNNSASAVLMKYIVDRKHAKEDDEIDTFFKSIAATVKKFSEYNQAIIKSKIYSTVSAMELQEIADKQHHSGYGNLYDANNGYNTVSNYNHSTPTTSTMGTSAQGGATGTEPQWRRVINLLNV